MTEKVLLNGKDVWLIVEPLTVPKDSSDEVPTEYFIVLYSLEEPGSQPGEMFREADNRPVLFESPVAAIQYATEKLLTMV